MYNFTYYNGDDSFSFFWQKDTWLVPSLVRGVSWSKEKLCHCIMVCTGMVGYINKIYRFIRKGDLLAYGTLCDLPAADAWLLYPDVKPLSPALKFILRGNVKQGSSDEKAEMQYLTFWQALALVLNTLVVAEFLLQQGGRELAVFFSFHTATERHTWTSPANTHVHV